MTHRIRACAVAWLIWAPAFAAPEAQPAPGVAPKPAATRPIPPSQNPAMRDLHASMKRLHEQMEQIRKTADPAAKEKLMNEHLIAMQEHMRLMQQSQVALGPGPGLGGGPQVMERRLGLLEQRMELMQQMVGQLLKHQEEATTMDSTGGKK